MITTEEYRKQLQDVYTEKDAVKAWLKYAESYNADQKAAYRAFMSNCRQLFMEYMDLVDNQNMALRLREETADKMAGDTWEEAKALPLYCIPSRHTPPIIPNFGVWLPELQFFASLGFIEFDEAASVKMIIKDKTPDAEY